MRDLQTITLRELLPPSIASDPDILAAADAIDAELAKATALIPGVSLVPRIREITDSAIIDLMAWGFHVDFYAATYTRDGTSSALGERKPIST
ncbi:hypothetical protein AGMMS49992_30150 [Clostridia bacterium]|nr:hypothetical protein AGMMS49992_30150 [Clostridia bacterium]